MPQIIPFIAAAAPIASSIFQSNSQADAARQAADEGRYGTDKNFDLGLKKIASEEGIQRSDQSFKTGQSALDRALQQLLQSTSGKQALEQISSRGNIEESLQKGQQGFQKGENALTRDFQQGQSALDRALQQLLQDTSGKQALEQISSRGNIEEGLQKGQQGFEQKQLDFQNKAFNDAINRANSQADEGESGFLNATSGTSPELKAYVDSVRQGKEREQEQATNQFKNNLTTAGVTGGQAATQLNRATGKMNADLNQNLNKIALDEAQKRQEQRANFYANKSSAGRSASYAKT